MKDELFDDLVGSVKEAGAWLRGQQDLPAEQIHFVGELDPRTIRKRLKLTQKMFAAMLGIDLETLRAWEQGRYQPSGPVLRLLQIAERYPDVLRELAA